MCWDSRVVERATSPTNLRTVESGEDLTRSFRPWIDRAFICFNHNLSSREVPWHSLLLRRRWRTARIGRRNSSRVGAHSSRPHAAAPPQSGPAGQLSTSQPLWPCPLPALPRHPTVAPGRPLLPTWLDLSSEHLGISTPAAGHGESPLSSWIIISQHQFVLFKKVVVCVTEGRMSVSIIAQSILGRNFSSISIKAQQFVVCENND